MRPIADSIVLAGLPTAVSDKCEVEMAARESCILCGGALEANLESLADTRFGTPGVYEIRGCRRCGLEQTVPVPGPAELKQLYESHYNFFGEEIRHYTRWRERFLFSPLYRFWIWIDGDISFHGRRGQGRLLDIGCNEGRGLRLYARNGFAAEGLELNEKAAQAAREAGFEVQTCPLEKLNPSVPYDVAVLSNVLEHSLNPRQMLTDVKRILRSGGRVWISCPNNQSWQRRVFGRCWINWHVPFHVAHFSEETLRQLLRNTGFSEIEIHQASPALWVAQSLIVRFWSRRGRATKQLRNPVLTLMLLFFVRGLLFPALWLGNKLGRGDCLMATATKG